MERATLRHDPLSRMSWLEFDGRPDEAVRVALKAAGWRWSGYRCQWYSNRRGAADLVPAGVEVEQGGECDYSAERADRLQASSQRHQVAASAAHQRVHDIASRIPLGQPILVGHHSERHARADIARIDAGMRRPVDEGRTAQHLSEAADASRRHQAHLATAGAIARRLATLEAEYRAMKRTLARMPEDSAYAARVEAKAAEVDRERERLEAAGGVAADALAPQVGDRVRIKGFVCRVERVNAKTLRCTVVEGGAKGWTSNFDKSWLQAVVERAAG
jgi:hypothetical protein